MIYSLVIWLLVSASASTVEIPPESNCKMAFDRTLGFLEQQNMALPVVLELQMIEEQMGPAKAEKFRQAREQTKFKFIRGGYGGFAFHGVITLHEILKESPYLQLVLVHELDHAAANLQPLGRKIKTLYTTDHAFRSEESAETRVWHFIRRNYQKEDLPMLYIKYIHNVERASKHIWYSAGLLDPSARNFVDKKRVLRQASRNPNNLILRGAATFLFNERFYETIRNALEMDQATFSERTLHEHEKQNALGNVLVGMFYSGHLIAAYSLLQTLGWLK